MWLIVANAVLGGLDTAPPSGIIEVGSTPLAKTTALTFYNDEAQKALQTRLSRVEGQVRGVARMLDEQRPCIEVLQQIASIQAALRGVSKSVLRNYLERCATDAIRSDDPNAYDELMDAIYKFAR
jgi:CsoR family transcriptional regulator, copper-sensing transcriptional repressor